VVAGVGINLALGILYTWSVIAGGVPEAWDWSSADKSLPYAIACLVFCLVMVPAGRMQDKLGPRRVATIGGILVGAGMILAAVMASWPELSLRGFILGFGVLAGAGIGFGYASATPAAVKWFPPEKTGMIAGIVVAGFGLASVYAAPLAKWLIASYGVAKAVGILGVMFFVVVVGLAQLLREPHKVIQFIKGYGNARIPKDASPPGMEKKEDFTPGEMLRTWQFYVLWFMYACGAGAGLMIIGKLAAIAKLQAGVSLGFLLVGALAVGNGGGRILAGILSDKIGRIGTMFGCFVVQAILILVLSRAADGTVLGTVPVLAMISALIGANYGANLSLFPSITKDYYGLKNFGVNYGLVFTAWGVGGFMLSLLAGRVYDKTQAFTFAFYTSIGLLIVGALVTFMVKAPHHVVAAATADDTEGQEQSAAEPAES